MTKGLHKNSLRKVDNPHQWMIDDARMELIQQIKAEVERRKEEAIKTTKNHDFDGGFYSGKSIALGSLLSFLSDLEKECEGKPITFQGDLAAPVPPTMTNPQDRLRFMEHWSNRHSKVQPVCEGLGKEMDRFFTSKEYAEAEKAGFGEAHTARHFTQWQKEQMMKDGLDAVRSGQFNKIEKTVAGVFVKYGMDRQRETMLKEAVEAVIYQVSETESRIWYPLNVKQYKEGDKVKIIIIKED